MKYKFMLIIVSMCLIGCNNDKYNKKELQVNTKTIEQLYTDYEQADDETRDLIKNIVLTRYGACDTDKLPSKLKLFINQIRSKNNA